MRLSEEDYPLWLLDNNTSELIRLARLGLAQENYRRAFDAIKSAYAISMLEAEEERDRLIALGRWADKYGIPKLKAMAECEQYTCNCDILSKEALDKLPKSP